MNGRSLHDKNRAALSIWKWLGLPFGMLPWDENITKPSAVEGHFGSVRSWMGFYSRDEKLNNFIRQKGKRETSTKFLLTFWRFTIINHNQSAIKLSEPRSYWTRKGGRRPPGGTLWPARAENFFSQWLRNVNFFMNHGSRSCYNSGWVLFFMIFRVCGVQKSALLPDGWIRCCQEARWKFLLFNEPLNGVLNHPKAAAASIFISHPRECKWDGRWLIDFIRKGFQ